MPESFKIIIGGRAYTVQVGDLSRSPITVVVNGETYEVELGREATAATSATAPTIRAVGPKVGEVSPSIPQPTATATQKTILAPMPGKVLAIKVRPGNRIKPGDTICILEAMKMEQEIRSNREGLVRAVPIIVGQIVGHNQILVELS